MIFFTDRRKAVFHGAVFREAAGDVANPGRGWYRIYTYTLGEEGDCGLPPTLYEGETLALVLIDIGAYREKPLGEDCLGLINRVLECFAQGGRDIILRVAYDTQGKGMEREPSLFSQVRQHIGQLAPLLVRHSSHILVFQGLLVGSWGEMHTSKFVSEKYLWQLSQSFLTETRGKIRFAVRKPVQCRIVQPENAVGETLTGCFDDAIFASDTHLGTFGTEDRQTAGWTKPWRPVEEMGFLSKISEKVPFGGEALSGEKGMSPLETLDRLRALHVSYLNCVHEEARLREWKETEYAYGISLYDYIGAHLGYRFVVESVTCEKKKKENCLKLKVTNRGFACCAEELQFFLHLQAEEGSVIPVDCGLGTLGAGESLTVSVPLGDRQPEEGVCFYGELRRVRDQKRIVFANEGAGERLFLGRYESVG